MAKQDGSKRISYPTPERLPADWDDARLGERPEQAVATCSLDHLGKAGSPAAAFARHGDRTAVALDVAPNWSPEALRRAVHAQAARLPADMGHAQTALPAHECQPLRYPLTSNIDGTDLGL